MTLYKIIPVLAITSFTRTPTKPESMDNWASRSVPGERVWMERASCDVPQHRVVQIRVLSGIQLPGILPLVWGLYSLESR